ncbi:DUF4352 domain-containing protein [Lentibacillus salicampi]|uniref:DUF4352 domain-containing protein n=1 Tax=Lentibacillus salicampi TaxID=175306 RepID=A0A4Y9AFK3_9BACI|nr:DUF4352 domain-containing protein [Lentibacillus salicampi]TFJ93154.1 DUF4352 domain-containing protein [Lentibacillus salicampi]
MKKFMKFGCLGFIGIIAIIVIISIASGGGETDTASTNGSNNDSANENKEDSSGEEKTEKLPGIGEAVEVGAMTYTINEKTTAKEVGPSVAPETASGKYIVLDITAVNNGNEAVTIDGSYFKIKQGEKTFEADSMASTTANQNEDGTIKNSFFMEQLNPGSELSGKVVFDVSPDVAGADNLKVEAQEGIFGSVTKTIKLQ